MKTAIKVALAAMMGSGALLLVPGIVIWTGNGDQLVPVHVAFGIVLVLSLWTIAAIAARAGVASGTVAFAAAWALLVAVLGLAQEELVPGRLHWVIQVLHLAISMGAIWWGRRLVRLIGQAQRSAGGPTVAAPVITTTRLDVEGRSHAEHQGGRGRVPGQEEDRRHGRVPDAEDPRQQQRLQAPSRTRL